MGADNVTERNKRILADIASGKRPRLVADQNNISRQWLHMIRKRKTGQVRTLEELPGSESLSAVTRGLLIRLGYTDLHKVIADIRSGRLYAGCAFGMGRYRFEEIKRLAEATGHEEIPVGDTQSNCAERRQSWLANLVDQAIDNSKRMENDAEYCSEIQMRSR